MSREVVFRDVAADTAVVETWDAASYPPIPVPGDVVLLGGDEWHVVDRTIARADDVYGLTCYVERV